MKPTADLNYRAIDSLFTAFYPNTPEGVVAWNDLAKQTDGTGKVFSIYTANTVRQLRAAGYSVSKSPMGKQGVAA